MTIFITTLWLAISWLWSPLFPRASDDAKNIFYIPAAILFLYLLKKRKEKFNFPIIGQVVGYFLIASISIVFGTAQYEGALELCRLFIWCGLTWSLVKLSEKQILAICRASTVSTSIMAVVLWLHLHGVAVWPSGLDANQVWPIGHVSYTGDWFALHIPLALFLLAHSRRFWWVICFLLCLAGLLWTGTRAAEVAALAGSGAALMLFFKTLRDCIFACTILFVCAFLIAMLSPQGVRGKIVQRWSDWKSPSRIEILNDVSVMSNEAPMFGWGLGSFRFVFPRFATSKPSASEWVYHAHNQIAQECAEVGFAGTMIWVSGVFILVGAGIRSKNELSRLGLVGVIIFMTATMFDTSFLFPLMRMMASLYAAMILRKDSNEDSDSYLNRRRRNNFDLLSD